MRLPCSGEDAAADSATDSCY